MLTGGSNCATEQYTRMELVMAVFRRNLTSQLMQSAAQTLLEQRSLPSVLELGCGDGNISRGLSEQFPYKQYFASDLSAEAIDAAKRANIDSSVTFKVGEGFQPWKGMKFHLIISDIRYLNQEQEIFMIMIIHICCK